MDRILEASVQGVDLQPDPLDADSNTNNGPISRDDVFGHVSPEEREEKDITKLAERDAE